MNLKDDMLGGDELAKSEKVGEDEEFRSVSKDADSRIRKTPLGY